ncbi:hypothetical protein BDY19DRAFT_415406 [Irpex rosettiformis]|uniref:Uncharacterized protein n=1 Tax=Irpex rosettiformis TaxID=378272 RepID=A0ACB8UG37_9APHY|nr:hypothetical protein BDY19DRAFT_415406 [Irpex rosettiformis]
MPNSGTEIIIPKHRHRSHSSVSSGSTYRAISPYRNQTYVTGPPTAVQYGPTFPAATALPPYMAPATSMVSAVPLVQQPFGLSAPMIPAVQPVQPVVTSYVPAMGNVYGDGMGYGGYGYPYRYGMGYGGGMYGAQWPGSGMGYGYGYGGGAMYYPQYSGGMGYGGYGGGAYPYMGSAYEYYGAPRAPFNQRIAGAYPGPMYVL